MNKIAKRVAHDGVRTWYDDVISLLLQWPYGTAVWAARAAELVRAQAGWCSVFVCLNKPGLAGDLQYDSGRTCDNYHNNC